MKVIKVEHTAPQGSPEHVTSVYHFEDGETLTYPAGGRSEYRDASGRDLSLSRLAAPMRAARQAFDRESSK